MRFSLNKFSDYRPYQLLPRVLMSPAWWLEKIVLRASFFVRGVAVLYQL